MPGTINKLIKRWTPQIIKRTRDELTEDYIEIVPHVPEEPVIIFGKEINVVLFEVIVGIIVFGLICKLTIVWFVNDKLAYCLGIWLGIITAVIYTIHMWWSIGQYLYMGNAAARYARKNMFLRYIVVAAVLILSATTDHIQFFAVVLGIFGIKAGASMQPFLQKYFRRGK